MNLAILIGGIYFLTGTTFAIRSASTIAVGSGVIENVYGLDEADERRWRSNMYWAAIALVIVLWPKMLWTAVRKRFAKEGTEAMRWGHQRPVLAREMAPPKLEHIVVEVPFAEEANTCDFHAKEGWALVNVAYFETSQRARLLFQRYDYPPNYGGPVPIR